MGKIDHTMLETVRNVDVGSAKMEISKGMESVQLKLESLFIQKGYLLFIIGFLLGRALILSHLMPFALPFFAAVYVTRREHSPLALLGLLAGSLTLSLSSLSFTFISVSLFLLSFRLTKSWRKDDFSTLAYYVGASTILSSIGFQYYVNQFEFTLYEGLMSSVEGGLAFILTLIFIQSIPLLSAQRRKKTLKTEEVVSLIILLASVMTGTIGWFIYDLSVGHILSRYLVLVFALVAGATVGSTVGVVTGLIFSLADVTSLYQMSLLAFAGLLGGLMKEGKKLGASMGLMIATLLIGMYGETETILVQTLYESAVAIFLIFLTPNGLTMKLAKHIPGTPEFAQEQQVYMRKVRDVTANRVAQFSTVFEALSKSFTQFDHFKDEDSDDKELDYFLSNVTEKTCQTCFKKEQCWANNFDKTYSLLKEVIYEHDIGNTPLSPRLSREFEKHCTRNNKVEEAISKELTFYQANLKLRKQVQESRKLVAEQLQGVSEVMGDFAKEIQKERENHDIQEEKILQSLEDFGIDIEHVDVFSLEKGNVDIDMTIPYCGGHGTCEKLIAPMLSDILGETIVVQREECANFPNGFCHVLFASAKKYVVETGVAHAAKGGGLVSGDSYSMIQLGAGKYAVAISDGMGNGERAHYESHETLTLIQKILQSGIEEKVAIKSVNSILSLRTTDEIFSTLDLAMIDLNNASSNFLKVGSTPSFIKRGDRVIKIEASNLPMGMFYEFDVDVVSEQLKAGDLLIMMSDGVFEGPKHVENYEAWMKRKIKEIDATNPQQVSDLIMEEVIRTRSGQIEDDMTVVVTQIQHNTPKWASISSPNYREKKKIS
ncbi:stage II sporulation protein E [Bacillus sp. 2205SS5-2]|uniref:stage II sporulation protein E n=1 Tax=Bacillus sp. 2205SS5-2 TaxID=3109031 RepID=UPI003005C87A